MVFCTNPTEYYLPITQELGLGVNVRAVAQLKLKQFGVALLVLVLCSETKKKHGHDGIVRSYSGAAGKLSC